MNDLILSILSALGGGLLASVLTYKLGNRKQDESEFISLVNEYKELTNNYKLEVDALSKKVDDLVIEVNKKNIEIVHLKNQKPA